MELRTVGDKLYWSYANLAMAHCAVTQGADQYQKTHYMVRKKLFVGLQNGTMNIGALADDERLKMILPQACCYCGSRDELTADHLIPRKVGGLHLGENLVWACRSCNSSKGARDALAWLASRRAFPPLLLLRRHLKLAIGHCREFDLLNLPADGAADLPFDLEAVPLRFPRPAELCLWVTPLDG